MMTLTAPVAKPRFEQVAIDQADRKAQNKRIQAVLQARWPHLFTYAQPLAIGIWIPLSAAVEDKISKKELRKFLRWWTRRPPYLAAIERGVRRLNLDGSDAGEADAGERIYRMTGVILNLATQSTGLTEDEMRAAVLEHDPEASAELVELAIARATALLRRRGEAPADLTAAG
jgi:sRNA-binding protein